jgi:membrane-associated protease RseP (regulator of RpoE activity)
MCSAADRIDSPHSLPSRIAACWSLLAPSLRTAVVVMAGLTAGLLLDSPALFAQAEPMGEATEGTIAAIEKKGRITQIRVGVIGGNTIDVDLTPKVALQIQFQGDEGFLVDGLLASMEGVESNQALFVEDVTIFPQHTGKLPPAKVAKLPPKAGRSMNAYGVSGEIVKFTPDNEGKYHQLSLKSTGKEPVVVYLEKPTRIEVIATNPELLEVGQKVELQGRVAGPKFLASQVTVKTGKELKAADDLERMRPAKKGKK